MDFWSETTFSLQYCLLVAYSVWWTIHLFWDYVCVCVLRVMSVSWYYYPPEALYINLFCSGDSDMVCERKKWTDMFGSFAIHSHTWNSHAPMSTERDRTFGSQDLVCGLNLSIYWHCLIACRTETTCVHMNSRSQEQCLWRGYLGVPNHDGLGEHAPQLQLSISRPFPLLISYHPNTRGKKESWK